MNDTKELDWNDGVKVVVVDDNLDNLASLQFVLDAAFRSGNDYCLNLDELLKVCRRLNEAGQNIGLLILDVMMGGTTGYEILKVVADLYPDLIVRVLIFTADKSVTPAIAAKNVTESLPAGSTTKLIGVLPKPVSPRAVTREIEEMWGKNYLA